MEAHLLEMKKKSANNREKRMHANVERNFVVGSLNDQPDESLHIYAK